MVTLRAKEMTLKEASDLLGFQPQFRGKFEDFLSLEPLTVREQTELGQIIENLLVYLAEGNISEGQARQIAINPLLNLAGYNQPPIELRIEEDIAQIDIQEQDNQIRGRFDLVAVNRTIATTTTALLWVLIVESKSLAASEFVGIAQMLTYAYTSLENQSAVWGLVTNGATYQFFHIAKGDSLTYEYMPSLRLLESDRATQLLQVLNAIRQWQPE
jgi:hypothetical protein